jgi:hypothetical protein
VTLRSLVPFLLVASGLLLLTLFSGIAVSNHYHTTCVGHGFVHGDSKTDNLFYARVEGGCGNPGRKLCRLLFIEGGGVYDTKTVAAGSNATCNLSSNKQWGEFASDAIVDFNGVFGQHSHNAH